MTLKSSNCSSSIVRSCKPTDPLPGLWCLQRMYRPKRKSMSYWLWQTPRVRRPSLTQYSQRTSLRNSEVDPMVGFCIVTRTSLGNSKLDPIVGLRMRSGPLTVFGRYPDCFCKAVRHVLGCSIPCMLSRMPPSLGPYGFRVWRLGFRV